MEFIQFETRFHGSKPHGLPGLELGLMVHELHAIDMGSIARTEIADDDLRTVDENLAMRLRNRGIMDRKRVVFAPADSGFLHCKFIRPALELFTDEYQFCHTCVSEAM